MNFSFMILTFRPIMHSRHDHPFYSWAERLSKGPRLVSEQGFELSPGRPQGPAYLLAARATEDANLG